MDKTCLECHPECERMDGNTTCSAPVCVPKLFFIFLGGSILVIILERI